MRLFKQKKAQLENYLAVVVILFVVSLASIFGYLILSKFLTEFNATGLCVGWCLTAGNRFLTALSLFDWGMIIIAIGLIVGVGLTSYRLPTDAAFFIVSVILVPIGGVISYVFNFTFSQIASHPQLAAILHVFPRTILICTNLHWIFLTAFIVGSITLFGKKSQGQFTPPA